MKRNRAKLITISAIFALLLITAFVVPSPLQASGPAAFDAAVTFKTKCASCHGLDGSGNTAYGKKENLRDLRSAEVQGQSDDQLLAIISKGKKKMAGFEKTLGADTCKQLVGYVRQLKR